MTRAFIATVALVVALVTGCSSTPDLPADDAAAAQLLTGSSGQDFLRDMTSHEWDDGGRAAGATLSWIGRDATSPDQSAAQRAGEAAHTVATFLADNTGALRDTANPELAQAFAAALIPFQGALAGDATSVRGFETGGNLGSGDYSRSRNVFAAIDADGAAGTRFTDAAYQRVHEYLRDWVPVADEATATPGVGLTYGPRLAGIVAGAQRQTGADTDAIRQSQYWVNRAGYEFAKASGARRGDPILGPEYFSQTNALIEFDQAPAELQDRYSTALLNFATAHGQGGLGGDVDRWYDEGAGT